MGGSSRTSRVLGVRRVVAAQRLSVVISPLARAAPAGTIGSPRSVVSVTIGSAPPATAQDRPARSAAPPNVDDRENAGLARHETGVVIATASTLPAAALASWPGFREVPKRAECPWIPRPS